MQTINQLLAKKGSDVWSVGEDASVFDAIRLMADKGVGALAVVEGDDLIGMVSERDYARKVILSGRSSKKTPVRDIMTRDVVTVRPENTVQECMAMMSERRFRHLPVVDGDRIAGMISIGDLVKAVISAQQETIEHLERYIAS